MTQKTCTRCLNSFPNTVEFFRLRNNRGVNYLGARCRTCERSLWKEYDKTRSRNIDQYKAGQKTYRDQDDHRQVANSRSKQWRKDHPEQAKTNVANWVATHQDQLRRLHREYMTKRRKTDPKFAVLCRLRSRLRKAFQRYSKNGKIKPSREYGIDYCAIFEHLGPCPGDGWEIDHIIPLALFDLDDPEQVREAFAPENHQWLLKPDNIRKGKKLTTCANDRFDEPIETIQSL